MPLNNSDDAPVRQLTKSEGGAWSPTWSPDGKWITYVSWGKGEGHLWKIRADGKGKPLQGGNHAIYTPVAFLVASPEIDLELVCEAVRSTICPRLRVLKD